MPVVVDFWACGAVRTETLDRALEDAVRRGEGESSSSSGTPCANQRIAQEFGIQSIPAVKAFRDGRVVAEFIGAQPPAAIESFLNQIAPSKADRLAEAGGEQSLREALELDPRHAGAAVGLGRLLLGRGDADEALEVLRPFTHDFIPTGWRPAPSCPPPRTDPTRASCRPPSRPGTRVNDEALEQLRECWRPSRTRTARTCSAA